MADAFLGVEAFPLSKGFWRHVGLVGEGAVMFVRGAWSGAADQVPIEYLGGFRFRGALGPVRCSTSLTYAFSSFGSVGPPVAELPNVAYRAVRAEVGALLPLGRLSLLGSVGLRAMVDPNGISSRFYGPKGVGLDVLVGGTFRVTRHVDLRLVGQYERYSFVFTPPSAAFGHGSATDERIAARLGASIAF